MMQVIEPSTSVGNDTYVHTTGYYNWPYNSWPYPWVNTVITSPPTDCFGDVHVFPCPHCDKCKCGGATKKAQR